MKTFIGRFIAKVIHMSMIAKQNRIYDTYRKQYDIAETFYFNGQEIALYGDGIIKLGENSYIGQRSSIQACKGARVEIGNGCSLSHNIRIYTSNLDPISIIRGQKSQEATKLGNVIIGDNCWVGANVFIKENVIIGHNCVIAANSLVTRNIPSNCIAMVVPAKVVKRFNLENNCLIKVE